MNFKCKIWYVITTHIANNILFIYVVHTTVMCMIRQLFPGVVLADVVFVWLLQVDFPNIAKLKKHLNKLTLDMDAVKSR